MGVRAGFAWLVVAACGREPPIGAPANSTRGEAPPEIGAVIDVCMGIDHHETITRYASAGWPAGTHAGKLFELIGKTGPVATVRITKREIECDDCAGPSVM